MLTLDGLADGWFARVLILAKNDEEKRVQWPGIGKERDFFHFPKTAGQVDVVFGAGRREGPLGWFLDLLFEGGRDEEEAGHLLRSCLLDRYTGDGGRNAPPSAPTIERQGPPAAPKPASFLVLTHFWRPGWGRSRTYYSGLIPRPRQRLQGPPRVARATNSMYNGYVRCPGLPPRPFNPCRPQSSQSSWRVPARVLAARGWASSIYNLGPA